jgi:hypothetical protein
VGHAGLSRALRPDDIGRARGHRSLKDRKDKAFDTGGQSAHRFEAACQDEPTELTTMNEKHSKPRQQAEIAFAKAQSQFRTRDTAAAGTDPARQARAENAQRLKAARLAKEAEDHATGAKATPSRQDIKA